MSDYQVFISYASENFDAALAMKGALEKHGIESYEYESEFNALENRSIEDKLNDILEICDAAIIVMTEEYLKKLIDDKHHYVKDELRMILNKKMHITWTTKTDSIFLKDNEDKIQEKFSILFSKCDFKKLNSIKEYHLLTEKLLENLEEKNLIKKTYKKIIDEFNRLSKLPDSQFFKKTQTTAFNFLELSNRKSAGTINSDDVRRKIFKDLLQSILFIDEAKCTYNLTVKYMLPTNEDMLVLKGKSLKYNEQLRYKVPYNLFKECDDIMLRYKVIISEIKYFDILLKYLIELEADLLDKLSYSKLIDNKQFDSKQTVEYYENFYNYSNQHITDIDILHLFSDEDYKYINEYLTIYYTKEGDIRYRARRKNCIYKCKCCVYDKHKCLSKWIISDMLQQLLDIITLNQGIYEQDITLAQYSYIHSDYYKKDMPYWRYENLIKGN